MSDKLEYLYKPCPAEPVATASDAEKAEWKVGYKKHNDVACPTSLAIFSPP